MSRTFRKNLIKDVVQLAVIFLMFLDSSCSAIKCYHCEITPNRYSYRNVTLESPLCIKFDESLDKFIKDCEFSTMCVKRISTFTLGDGQIIETMTRGCANQKYTDQVFNKTGGKWQQKHRVEEPYEEGCFDHKENKLAASKVRNCYCRGELCNSASKSEAKIALAVIAVLSIFNIFRFYQ